MHKQEETFPDFVFLLDFQTADKLSANYKVFIFQDCFFYLSITAAFAKEKQTL